MKKSKHAAIELSIAQTRIIPAYLNSVREDLRDSPYIEEALRVLPVEGYRSAIGAIWNAVVDDLRNKIIARSLDLFNKSVSPSRPIKNYDDFQDLITDEVLIEGAYKTGVIDWEARKILRHCKEVRHIFSGHPKSSDPSPMKVAALIEDCVRYVLAVPFPPTLINVDEYMKQLDKADFARNDVAVEDAVADLPDVYKESLVNQLFTAYIHPQSSTNLRSNIEFVAPFLWSVLTKETRIQVVRRADQEIPKGNGTAIGQALSFIQVVDGMSYLSVTTRKYATKPWIDQLSANLDQWSKESEAVRELEPYAALIPQDLIENYITSMTLTYVGYIGGSSQYARTDFYSNGAATRIPKMLEHIDDRGASAFIEAIRSNKQLRRRIASSAAKLRRLRALAIIVEERASKKVSDRRLLETLADEDLEEEFLGLARLRVEEYDD